MPAFISAVNAGRCFLAIEETAIISLGIAEIINAAKKKPIEEKTPGDFGVDVSPRFKVLKVTEPPKRAAGAKVASVTELLDKLKADGVI